MKEEKIDKIAKISGKVIANIIMKILFSYGLIYAINVFFKTSFPYDFSHVFSLWIILTLFKI